VYEMTAQEPPFKARDMKGLYMKIIKGRYPPIPSHYSTNLGRIIHSMLQKSPSKRPTCSDLLSNRIIRLQIDEDSQSIDQDETQLSLKSATSTSIAAATSSSAIATTATSTIATTAATAIAAFANNWHWIRHTSTMIMVGHHLSPARDVSVTRVE